MAVNRAIARAGIDRLWKRLGHMLVIAGFSQISRPKRRRLIRNHAVEPGPILHVQGARVPTLPDLNPADA